MSDDVKSYPLQWPAGFAHWKTDRHNGAFKTTFATAKAERVA